MNRTTACVLIAGGMLVSALPARAADPDLALVPLKQFYDWYLIQPKHDWLPHLAQERALFDPFLYTSLETVVNSHANKRGPILDFDPFVNAQWDAAAYHLGTPSAKGNDVLVPVTLNLSDRPNAKTTLTAVLRKNAAGNYVIYNLVYDTTFNLRDFLQHQLQAK